MTINKDYINDAILLLGKTYANPEPKDIEKAISFLRKANIERKELVAIQAKLVRAGASNFIRSGVPWFDEWLRGGVRLQEVLLFGTTPHTGKTHLLSWFGSQFLLEGYPVITFVGEDILSDVREYYELGVQGAREALENLWLVDVQDSRFGVPEVEQVLDKFHAEGHRQDGEPLIIILDHVDLMKGGTNIKGQSWEIIEEIMAELKLLAKRTNTFIASASQLGYNREARGMERFYKSKTGKAGWSDIVIFVDDVIGDDYDVSLLKARGRKRISQEARHKVLHCDWDSMTIEDIS